MITHPTKTESDDTEPATPSILRRRLRAVAATTIALGVTWAIVDSVTDVTGPAFGGQEPTEVIVPAVIVSTLVMTSLGWLTLAALERWTSRPGRVWTGMAIAATLASLVSPMLGEGADLSDRLLLAGAHLLVAALFVPMMRAAITAPSIRRADTVETR